MKEKKIKKRIIGFLEFVLGLTIFSLAFNLFLLPNNLVFGGVSGLSIVFNSKFGIDPSMFTLTVNVGLLFVSFAFLGKDMTARGIIGSLLLPLFMKLTEIVTIYVNFEGIDLLVAALYGGVLAGIGIGLVYKTGFNTGGTDIVNLIINKYVGFSIGKSMFVSDGLIVALGVFVFGIVNSMYAGIVLFLLSKLSDRVILGIGRSKAVYIITDEPDKVKEYIVNKLGHGITELNVKGGFKKETQKLLFTVIPTQEYYLIKSELNKIDKSAFFVVVDAFESRGGV